MADMIVAAHVSASTEITEKGDLGLLNWNDALQPHRKLPKDGADAIKLGQWFSNDMQA